MATLSKATRKLFQDWGSLGGNKAARNMTAKQRRDRALKAVAARETKRK